MYFVSNPLTAILSLLYSSYFSGKDINSIKSEMKKLRDCIEKTKNRAKQSGHYYGDDINTGEPSFEENWFVENCAEIWAVRDAILQGSKVDNIVIRSVNISDGTIKPLCENCKVTFEDFLQAME